MHRPPLASLRLLGEGVGAALIRPDGEINWWCPNRFEAPPVLWSLLDERGGRSWWDGAEVATWDACPAGPTSCTTVRISGERVQLWDGLLATMGGGTMLVRLARPERRTVALTHRLRVGGFDGPRSPWRTGTHGASNGELHVAGGRVEIQAGTGETGDVAIRFNASPGAWAGFAVLAGDVTLHGSLDDAALAEALRAAEADERRVMDKVRLPDRHESRATDALRVLRALTDPATGAPAASPTTSLPEAPGGGRQFDYRYSWLRDSGLAVAVAASLGHLHAASRYLGFIGQLLERDDALRPLSTTNGHVVPPEREVHAVAGWADSRPIRVGNAARDQVQLDAVATVLDAVWSYASSGGPVDGRTWRLVNDLASRLADTPFGPTSGVWELRDPQRLVSEEIARWHGLQCALRVRRWFRPWLRRPAWRTARDGARHRVETAIDSVTGRLPQSFDPRSDHDGAPPDGPLADASALMAAISGLARDRRGRRLVTATIQALEQGAFLRRYPPADDGFDGVEACFVPASWWAVTALARVGDVDAAQSRVDDLCAQLPPLQPEEWDVERGEALGNTPLLWSHMEAARALYVLQRERVRRRFGNLGLGAWSAGRYLRLRLTRHRRAAP